ncbi:MAG: CPCC family cysteine-rich protein [Acidimicrobiales bacterium]
MGDYDWVVITWSRASPRRHACPCCGLRTIVDDHVPPGTYSTCPVCGWEDDLVQCRDPDYRGGANDDSLNQVRTAFEIWRDAGMPPDDRRRPPLPAELP